MKKLSYGIIAAGFIVSVWYAVSADFRQSVYYQYYTRLKHPEIAGGPCGPNCNGYNEFLNENLLTNTDTLPLFEERKADRMLLTGVIHDFSGKPAADVLLYVFHTDAQGEYPKRAGATGAEALNGYIRGWIKTNADGRYYIFTNMPGAYPEEKTRAHVHCIIKEPDVNVYSLMDFIFPNDPYAESHETIVPQHLNGGLVKDITQPGDTMKVYQRNIYLGRGVVNYPSKKKGA
jgi:protocatechuate 3,4-dioxygenase beta subunit